MSDPPGAGPAAGGDPSFTTPGMSAIFSARARVRRMFAVEAALARAQARAGVIPTQHAEQIETACAQDRTDAGLDAILREGAVDGTPVIPLLRRLRAPLGEDAARSLHWGATSQDILDTATALQMSDGLGLIARQLRQVGERCAALAEDERDTLMPGRRLLQQALPIPFGLKAAGWLDAVTRRRERLATVRADAATVQLGGAAGTLAALGSRGPQVVSLFAEQLDLNAPALPWHTQRDRVAEVVAGLGIVCGVMAKIAGDIILLAQTEVGEVTATPDGGGGSSSLPQKRNPVDAIFAIAASRVGQSAVPGILASMAQEHERAVGGWQAEWALVPQAFEATSAAVARTAAALASLRIDAAQMGRNLERGYGTIMAESVVTALTPRLGRTPAQDAVARACAIAIANDTPLAGVLAADAQIAAVLSAAQIAEALDPAGYLGASEVFIDRALARHRARQSQEQSDP